MRCYCVYIMASRSRVLYAGVTNDIVRRVDEHKRGLIPGFTRKYHVTRLVYFERCAEVRAAIAREKEIKEFHPVLFSRRAAACHPERARDRKSTRLNSSHRSISYAVFCLRKKTHDLNHGIL